MSKFKGGWVGGRYWQDDEEAISGTWCPFSGGRKKCTSYFCMAWVYYPGIEGDYGTCMLIPELIGSKGQYNDLP